MEMRDVAIVLVISAGVLALKGFYDVFASLPFWTIYVVIALFLAFSFAGIFLFLGDLSSKANSVGGFTFSRITFDAKKTIWNAVVFWLNWPWWILLLTLWKLFEPWTNGGLKTAGDWLGLDAGIQVPLLGSPLALLSLMATYLVLVLFTALFVSINPIPSKGAHAGDCSRCGSKHSIADNYCSTCGAILPRKKL